MLLSSLDPSSSQMDRKSGHVFCGQMSPCFSCFWEKCMQGSKSQRGKNSPGCHQREVQKPASAMIWACISAHSTGVLQIFEGSIDVGACIGASRRRLFLREQCQTSFYRTYNSMTLYTQEKHVSHGFASRPHVSQSENVWCIIRRELRQQNQPWPVKQLKSCIQQMDPDSSSVLKQLKSVIKRKWDTT